jgi:hypothetical protein
MNIAAYSVAIFPKSSSDLSIVSELLLLSAEYDRVQVL